MNKKTLDNFANAMLNSAISGINQAVAVKQKEVNYWRNKAEVLAVKYKACLYCQTNKNYMPETLTCKDCHRKEVK